MAKMTFKATASKGSGITIDCGSRKFKLVLDEPSNLGGNDKGMNPCEAMLCSLGACQAIVAGLYAKPKKIDLQNFWVELEGDIDSDGFTGKKDVRSGFQEIRTKVHVKSSSPEDKIKEFVEFIEKTCPIADTIAHSAKMIPEVIIER